jgi:hypothetical protein
MFGPITISYIIVSGGIFVEYLINNRKSIMESIKAWTSLLIVLIFLFFFAIVGFVTGVPYKRIWRFMREECHI